MIVADLRRDVLNRVVARDQPFLRLLHAHPHQVVDELLSEFFFEERAEIRRAVLEGVA